MFAAVIFAALLRPAPTPTPWVPELLAGQTLPVDPAFVDQDGRAFRWHDLSGKSVVLAFFYARCRESNECPATSAKFAEMQRGIPPNIRLLEVTLDPGHDSPAVLKSYGTMFDQDARVWTLATGNTADLRSFARRFRVDVAPSRQPGQLEHGEALVIFDPRQQLVSVTAGNEWQPQEALAVAAQAANEPHSPLAAMMLWFRNIATTCGALLSSDPSQRSTRIVIASVAALAMIAVFIVGGWLVSSQFLRK
jgi:cytochrome oxidase Cu insertion factor (SCO1/SenC/PrrC family)